MIPFFKLYGNCIPVKGFNRSLIVDLQRDAVHLIPNDLYEVLIKSRKNDLNQIYSEYGPENHTALKEYFEMLEELELGFYCSEDELDYFPEIKLDFYLPAKISNAIIEGINDVQTFQKLIPQLENLGCEYLDIVIYDAISNENVIEILDLFYTSSVKFIGLTIKFDENKDECFVKSLTSTKMRLSKLILHSANEEKVLNIEEYNLIFVQYLLNDFETFSFCGIVSQGYFVSNMSHFTESQHHNTCLNKKISIDKDGNIKNCPSMKESFGNIKDMTLEEALNHPNFKKYWNITKDQIEVCKDCEFRHICTDCRAYVESPEDQYSKPLKCGYDPYTNKWEEWSTNPLKQKAIEYYGMQELIKKNA